MTFSVYFNAKKETETKVHLGVVVFEGFEKFPPIDAVIDAKHDATFYDYETEALLLALEVIGEEEYDEVILYNQNKLVFDWITKTTHENSLRDSNYHKVREQLKGLAEQDISVSYKVIKGDKNEAKKYLTDKIKSIGQSSTDLTALFSKSKKEKDSKVIKINHRKVR